MFNRLKLVVISILLFVWVFASAEPLRQSLQIDKIDIPQSQLPPRFSQLLAGIPLEAPGAAVTQNFLATIINDPNDSRHQSTRVFTTDRNLSEEYTIYHNYLNSHNWTISSTLVQPSIQSIFARKPDPLLNTDLYFDFQVSQNSITGIKLVYIDLVWQPPLDCTLACTPTVPTTGNIGTTITFQSSAASSGGCLSSPTFDWNFDDGTPNSSQQNPTHTFTQTGTYKWTLTCFAGTRVSVKTGTVTIAGAVPLIFIPGIAGTTLERIDTNPGEIFPGSLGDNRWPELTRDPADQPWPSILATKVIGSTISGPIYAPIVNWLISKGYNTQPVDGKPQNLFLLPYDWRLSNSSNDELLRQLITQIRQKPEYSNSNVDILAHSMGGLVARRYILKNSNNHVRKLITVGTPWLGAPKSIATLENGEFIRALGFAYRPRTIKELAKDFRSIHQLLPSSKYFDFEKSPLQWLGKDLNYQDFVNNLNGRYYSLPGTVGNIFHKEPGQDNFSENHDGIQYFIIAGKQPNNNTIRQVKVSKSLFGGFVQNYTYTQGDGTVPLVSSALTPALTQGVTVKVIDGPNNDLTDHVGLIKNEHVWSEIYVALTGSQQQAFSETFTVSAAATPSYYLHLSGSANVNVSDASGNSLNLNNDSFTGDVPDVTPFAAGENTFSIVIPTGQTYNVIFTTGATPINLELTLGDGSTPSHAIRYLDVSLPTNINAKITITPSGPGALEYDSNSDGTFESQVNPTVTATGAAAADTTPPVVSFSASVQEQTSVLVTLSAQDSQSAVTGIRYSIDGTNIQFYTAPFSVNPSQSPFIYAFADDAVGNRSSLETFSVTPVLANTKQFFTASGGNGSVSLTALTGLNWVATSNASWLGIASGSSGSGNGSVTFTVQVNDVASARSGTLSIGGRTFTITQGAAFQDVASDYLFYTEIGKLSASGVTVGCGGGNYCTEAVVTREQMAVFLIRALGVYNPPTPTSQRFADVGPERFGYAFIEELAKRGITVGCGNGIYCPDSPVTRDQMAVFIERVLGVFEPPTPLQQRFLDVEPESFGYAFIDDFAARGITFGCGGGNYCPGQPVTRAQMAAFLVRAFGL